MGAGGAEPAVIFSDCSFGAGWICSVVPPVIFCDCAVCPSPLGCSATDGLACICRWASWEFAGLPGLAPSACCAAVGWPCIWRCVSCDDAATSPLARFIVSVGGCCFASVAIPVVWLLLCDAGPEPASLSVRPVSHGPAHAVPAP